MNTKEKKLKTQWLNKTNLYRSCIAGLKPSSLLSSTLKPDLDPSIPNSSVELSVQSSRRPKTHKNTVKGQALSTKHCIVRMTEKKIITAARL